MKTYRPQYGLKIGQTYKLQFYKFCFEMIINTIEGDAREEIINVEELPSPDSYKRGYKKVDGLELYCTHHQKRYGFRLSVIKEEIRNIEGFCVDHYYDNYPIHGNYVIYMMNGVENRHFVM